ncbi:MAG: uL15 family ribosomal protein [Thermoplasmatota archaeon]
MASGGRAKRFRGNHTHGRGKKAGRGAGLRGGRGRAGANKHRYLMLQLLGGKHAHTAARPWGRIGFKYRSRDGNPRPETVNVGDLARRFPGQGELDLSLHGVGKLLGAGNIAHKVNVKVDEASEGAIAKVQAAGGQVAVMAPKPAKESKPDAKAQAKPDTKGAKPDAKPGAKPDSKAAKPDAKGAPASGKPAKGSGKDAQ